MTIEEVCAAFNLDDIGEFSDGYHTFNSLYHQRAILFAALVAVYKDKAWKSWKHEGCDENCFGGGWFIVGIDTPAGSYTYHYESKYWHLFDCQELDHGKPWDGHTDKDVERLLSLRFTDDWISVTDDLPTFGEYVQCYARDTEFERGYVTDAKLRKDRGVWDAEVWESRDGVLHIGCITHWKPLPKPPKTKNLNREEKEGSADA